MNRRNFIAGMGAGLLGGLAFGQAAAEPNPETAARDAWLFALPIIEVSTRRASPNPNSGQPAPINAFTHGRSLSDPTTRGVTTSNNDTLYSNAFVDLANSPVSLDIPDCGPRYLSVEIMDMYTDNNFIIGPRTPQNAADRWRLIPPQAEPRSPRDLRLSTPHGWLIARILVDGLPDLPAVHAIQDRLLLDGPAAALPINIASRLSPWPTYFAAAAELLKSDPPPFRNGLEAFVKVCDANRGRDFLRTGYTSDAAAAIDSGVADARALVRSLRGRKFINGWTYPRPDLGEYHDNFNFRAMVAVAGLGALNPSEAMYMRSAGDGQGLFEGDGLYRLSLSAPIPVDAFWSLTMYQALPDGRFFLTEDSLNRYAIGDRTTGLVRRSDRSLDIWISRSDPGDVHTANWLPAPKRGPSL
jgi:hypothetical protein